VGDPMLMRFFCEGFLVRHPFVDQLAAAATPEQAIQAFNVILELWDNEHWVASRARFTRAGGVTAIVEAMMRHKGMESAQEIGCDLLWEIGLNNIEIKTLTV
jgi:hypothetical protein